MHLGFSESSNIPFNQFKCFACEVLKINLAVKTPINRAVSMVGTYVSSVAIISQQPTIFHILIPK